jgi:hypothetical protein
MLGCAGCAGCVGWPDRRVACEAEVVLRAGRTSVNWAVGHRLVVNRFVFDWGVLRTTFGMHKRFAAYAQHTPITHIPIHNQSVSDGPIHGRPTRTQHHFRFTSYASVWPPNATGTTRTTKHPINNTRIMSTTPPPPWPPAPTTNPCIACATARGDTYLQHTYRTTTSSQPAYAQTPCSMPSGLSPRFNPLRHDSRMHNATDSPRNPINQQPTHRPQFSHNSLFTARICTSIMLTEVRPESPLQPFASR